MILLFVRIISLARIVRKRATGSLIAMKSTTILINIKGMVGVEFPLARMPSPALTYPPPSWAATLLLFSSLQNNGRLSGPIWNTSVSANRLNDEYDKRLWIIDTGATHHVIVDKSWLFDLNFFDCPVGLPNGAYVISTMVGSVLFNLSHNS